MNLRWFKSIYNILKSSFDTKGGTFCFEDNELVTQLDRQRFADAYQLWVAAIIDEQNIVEFRQAQRVVEQFQFIWKCLYLGYPVDSFFSFLKKMTTWLRSESSLTLLKQMVADDFVCAELIRVLIPLLMERRTPLGFMHLHRVLVFLAKFSFEHEGLSEMGRLSWFDHEKHLATTSISLTAAESDRICDIIATFLQDFDPAKIELGYYTSGSTADAGPYLSEKIHCRKVTTQLGELAVTETPQLCHLAPLEVTRDYNFVSKWIQVPKTALSLREISMEPAALNWWQSALDDHLKKVSRPYIKRFYDPEDQRISRYMAIEGSRTGNLATIDLSKASDSVTTEMILAWFPPRAAKWLLACRSPYAKIGDEIVPLNKFAPMGSRLTFTIESMIFTALGILALERSGIPKTAQRLRVYGDDIVINSDAAETLYDILDRTGFIPNKDKSYATGHFREACGTFAFQGKDITGVAMPRKRFRCFSALDSGSACWLAEMSNRAYYTNSLIVRYVIVRTLMNYGMPKFHSPSIGEYMELFDGLSYVHSPLGSISLVSDEPTDWQLRTRPTPKLPDNWKRKLKRLPPFKYGDYGHGQVLRLTPFQKTVSESESAAYEKWLYNATYRRSDTMLCDVSEDCRSREHHSLPPRNAWIDNPG